MARNKFFHTRRIRVGATKSGSKLPPSKEPGPYGVRRLAAALPTDSTSEMSPLKPSGKPRVVSASRSALMFHVCHSEFV